MTIPLTLYEQMHNNWFEPTHRLAFIFGMSKFDAVWKRHKDGSFKQAFANLDTIKDDCMQLSECLEKYQIMTKNVYNLQNNPSSRDVSTAIEQISRRMRDGKKKKPMERYLLIFLFAGHGLQKDGMQVMLYNEFNKKTNFYELFRAEQKLRQFSEVFQNSYVIGIFACCRQMYDHTWMEGGQCISHEQYLNITGEKGSEEQLLAHHQNLFNIQQKEFGEQYTTCLKDIETSFKRRIIEAQHEQLENAKSILEQKLGDTMKGSRPGIDSITLNKFASKKVSRAYGYCSEEVHQNFLLIFGCPASKTVSADTSMVQEIAATMDARFNKDTLKLTIPAAFEHLKGSDAKLEMAISNPIQPLNLFYAHNIVTDSIGYIFVNTESKGLIYTNAAVKGMYAKTLLKDILQFKEVEVFTDLPKEEIIQKLEQLGARALHQKQKFINLRLFSKIIFESLDENKDGTLTREQCWTYVQKMSKKTGQAVTQEEFSAQFSKLDFDANGKVNYKELQSQGLDKQAVQDTLAIGIIWVGHALDPDYQRHKNIIQKLGIFKDYEKDDYKIIGNDHSELYPLFELSHLGEPICINEYASNIAKHKGCHVIQLDDYQQEMGQQLTIDNVASQPQQQELILKTRPGRESHMFFPETDIDQVVQLFHSRKSNISQVFCLPYHLAECGPEIHVWGNDQKRREQVIFDLRGEKEKCDTKKNIMTHTFKRHNCDVWQDRPELMNYEVAYPNIWRTTVHYLQNQEVIVQIVLDVDPAKIVIVFFNPVTFYEDARVKCERNHFNCAMVVEDRLQDERQDADSFYAVIFTSKEDSKSSQLIKFSKLKAKWTVQKAQECVSHPDESEAQFVTAFQVKRDRIMLVTWYNALTYNAALDLLQTHEVKDIYQRVEGIQVCAKDLLSANQRGYLISFQVDLDKIEKTDYTHIEQDLTTLNFGFSSLIYRCQYDASSQKIVRDENQESSLLLANERVEAILEYAPNKSAISLYPTDLLLTHCWKRVKIIKKIQPGNFNKHWLLPMPGFNEQKYPFLICSGREIFNLINVRDQKMVPLIQAPCINIRSQQAFFFKKEDSGFTMHFTTVQLTGENLEQQKWHMLPFKEDFVEYLIKYGLLPVTSFKMKQELHSKFDSLRFNTQESYRIGTNTSLQDPRHTISNSLQQDPLLSNQADLKLQYDNLQVKFNKQQEHVVQIETKKTAVTQQNKNLLAMYEETDKLKTIMEEKVVALENNQQELVTRLQTSSKALQTSKSQLQDERNQNSQQKSYRQLQQKPKYQDLSVLHEVIQSKDSEIQAKSEQIQSLKTMIQGGEQSVSLSVRHKKEMNKVVEENKRFKAIIKDLETEVKCMKQVERKQAGALVGAKKQNNEAYIQALEDENNKIKAEKRQLKELFDQTIKDQIQLHDQNVQLRTKLRNVAKRYNAPSQQEDIHTYTQELIKALEQQETNVEYLKIQLIEKEKQNKLFQIKLNALLQQKKNQQYSSDQPLELDMDFALSSPRNQNKMSLDNFMISEPPKAAQFMQFAPFKDDQLDYSTDYSRQVPWKPQNGPVKQKFRTRNRSVNEESGPSNFISSEKNFIDGLGMIQQQQNVNKKQKQFIEQNLSNVTSPKYIRGEKLRKQHKQKYYQQRDDNDSTPPNRNEPR